MYQEDSGNSVVADAHDSSESDAGLRMQVVHDDVVIHTRRILVIHNDLV